MSDLTEAARAEAYEYVVSDLATALARIDELEALCEQALVVIRQGVDEVLRLDPHIDHPDGTGWDCGQFLLEARRALEADR